MRWDVYVRNFCYNIWLEFWGSQDLNVTITTYMEQQINRKKHIENLEKETNLETIAQEVKKAEEEKEVDEVKKVKEVQRFKEAK